MRSTRLARLIIFAVIVCALLEGCSGGGFRMQNLGKGAIDFVADAHYRESQNLLKDLTRKLYLRNPSQLKKYSGMSIEVRIEQLFAPGGRVLFAELNFAEGTKALDLALNPSFSGDRVLAMMAGLNGMVRNTYEYRTESYMLDRLDEQKFFQSARNVEILIWRLKYLEQDSLRPLLLTNSLSGEPDNLSFERLFGKLIALQDMMAAIVAQQNDRLLVNVTQNVATMVFFPL